MAFGQSIDVNGDKQVGLVVVGNLSTTIELHKLVGLTGIDHLHIGAVFLYQLSEGEGELQGQVLLTGLGNTDSTCVTTTMSGINHQCEFLILRISRCYREKKRDQDE